MPKCDGDNCTTVIPWRMDPEKSRIEILNERTPPSAQKTLDNKGPGRQDLVPFSVEKVHKRLLDVLMDALVWPHPSLKPVEFKSLCKACWVKQTRNRFITS